MTANEFRHTTPARVRRWASQGELAGRAAAAGSEARRCLRASVFEIAQPVVFWNLTRKLELRRGHYGCASAVSQLDDQCLDRFHDDMDAVIEDVFRSASIPIGSLEGWIRSRLMHATVDGNRRRRGERGALQRPRVPQWLAAELGHDHTLMALAVDILDFVGTDATLVTGIWPTDNWADRRVARGADPVSVHHRLARDIEVVLAAMRVRPRWYANYVQRPLDHKRPVAVPLSSFSSDNGVECLVESVFRAAEPDVLAMQAAVAVAAIDSRIAAGEAPVTVVTDVVSSVFDEQPWCTEPAAVDRILAALTAS